MTIKEKTILYTSFLYIANNIIFLQLSPPTRPVSICLHPVLPFTSPSIAALSPLSPLAVLSSLFFHPRFFFDIPSPPVWGWDQTSLAIRQALTSIEGHLGFSLELAQHHGEMSRVHHGQAESERRDA